MQLLSPLYHRDPSSKAVAALPLPRPALQAGGTPRQLLGSSFSPVFAWKEQLNTEQQILNWIETTQIRSQSRNRMGGSSREMLFLFFYFLSRHACKVSKKNCPGTSVLYCFCMFRPVKELPDLLRKASYSFLLLHFSIPSLGCACLSSTQALITAFPPSSLYSCLFHLQPPPCSTIQAAVDSSLSTCICWVCALGFKYCVQVLLDRLYYRLI